MLAPSVLAELGAFSFFQGLYPTQTISIAGGPRKYRFEQYSSSKGKATNKRLFKAERPAKLSSRNAVPIGFADGNHP
jgi:hypothetical protein